MQDKELLHLVGEQRKQEAQTELLKQNLLYAEESAKRASEDLNHQMEEVKRLSKIEKEQRVSEAHCVLLRSPGKHGSNYQLLLSYNRKRQKV